MKGKIALGLVAATVLSLGGGAYAYAKTTPAAYVSVDINPSVELGVNSFGKVISAQAYNEDGQKVLEGTNLVNFDVEKAVSTVISNAISDGYIKEDVTTTAAVAVAVEITTSTDKEKIATELDKSLKEAADKTLENNNVNAEAESENVALARRDEARQLGITPGKLNLIQKLQALDPTITVEDYKSSSVKDIQKKAKELREMNKSEETNTNSSTNTDTNANTDINVETNTNSDAVTEEKANHSSNANGNTKKEDSTIVNDKEKDTTTKSEKQDNSSNSNSQNNKNNSNSDQQNKSSNKEKGKNK